MKHARSEHRTTITSEPAAEAKAVLEAIKPGAPMERWWCESLLCKSAHTVDGVHYLKGKSVPSKQSCSRLSSTRCGTFRQMAVDGHCLHKELWHTRGFTSGTEASVFLSLSDCTCVNVFLGKTVG